MNLQDEERVFKLWDSKEKKVIEVKAKRVSGAEYKTNCPFHNDHNPSFFINPGKEFYHCFGCGKSGQLYNPTIAKGRKFHRKGNKYENLLVSYKTLLDEKGKLDLYEVAKFVMGFLPFKAFQDSYELFYFFNGVYHPRGETVVGQFLERQIPNELSKYKISEIIGHVIRCTFIKRENFNNDKSLISLENGFFNLNEWELEELSPEKYFTYQLPVKFKENADCPLVKKFFQEILHPDDVPLMQEIFGYCLYPDYPSHKSFWFLGQGRNGKTVTQNLLKTLLGKQNITSIDIHKLEKEKFALAGLYGKLANIVGEPDPKPLIKSSVFKQCTGQDTLLAEKKHIQDRIAFTNFAKFIIAANRIGEIRDLSPAFWERVKVIEFPNFFGDEEADKNLLEKLTVEQEMEGLLKWALEGLKRLKENNWAFSKTKSTEETKSNMQRYTNPIRTFVDESCRISSGTYTEKDKLYQAYVNFCENTITIPKTKNAFSQGLTIIPGITTGRRTIANKKVYVYEGISLKC